MYHQRDQYGYIDIRCYTRRITFPIRQDQNQVGARTPDLAIAKVQQTTTLHMASNPHAFNAEIALLENSSKGVIIGIAAICTPDELIEHVQSANAEISHDDRQI